MAQPDDLTESLRHLEYEVAMIVAASRMVYLHPLQEPNTSRQPGYYWANDQAVAYLAGMESALTHARLLDDFFKCTVKPTGDSAKAKDRYALEYCTQNGWPGFEMLTNDQHTAIDKQLSHLTTQRAPRKQHPLGHYARQAVKALTLLTMQADPQWQGHLADIVAKARAEQQRSPEAWNPH